MSKPCILFRSSRETLSELETASKYFEVTDERVGLVDRLVIGRYSVLPYYWELEKSLKKQGSYLINSYDQHQYIANFDYYHDVKHLTPKTWFQLQDVPKDGGPYVVKGRTNSRKFQWATHMYAKDYTIASRIYSELLNDPLISQQGALVREYVPLKTVEYGINDMPMANEWRFFFWKNTLLSYGFYWTIAEQPGEINKDGVLFAMNAAKIIAEKANFFVLDIAQTEKGDWTLIEVNDGQMSGLSDNNADMLYASLREAMGTT